MYRGIIEHRLSLTVYLRDYILSRQLEQPTGFGRIYRVVHDSTRRDPFSREGRALSKASPAQLVEALVPSKRLVARYRAAPARRAVGRALAWRRQLRSKVEAAGARRKGFAYAPSCALDARRDRRDRACHGCAARWRIASRDVRASAVRIAERWLGEANHPIQSAVLKRMDDPDWAVRHQLAASLGAMPPGSRDAAAVALLERHAGDPIAVDAALSGLRGSEAAVLENMMQAGGQQTPDREAVITILAATIVRGAQDAEVHTVFGWVGDRSRASWQRAALLRGAEVALLGAADAGGADRTTRRRAVDRIAVPDVSGRARRPGRCIRLLETGRLHRRFRRTSERSRRRTSPRSESRTGSVVGAGEGR